MADNTHLRITKEQQRFLERQVEALITQHEKAIDKKYDPYHERHNTGNTELKRLREQREKLNARIAEIEERIYKETSAKRERARALLDQHATDVRRAVVFGCSGVTGDANAILAAVDKFTKLTF